MATDRARNDKNIENCKKWYAKNVKDVPDPTEDCNDFDKGGVDFAQPGWFSMDKPTRNGFGVEITKASEAYSLKGDIARSKLPQKPAERPLNTRSIPSEPDRPNLPVCNSWQRGPFNVWRVKNKDASGKFNDCNEFALPSEKYKDKQSRDVLSEKYRNYDDNMAATAAANLANVNNQVYPLTRAGVSYGGGRKSRNRKRSRRKSRKSRR